MKLNVILLIALAGLICLVTQIRSENYQSDSSDFITLIDKVESETENTKIDFKNRKWQRKAKNQNQNQNQLLDIDQETKDLNDNEYEQSSKKSPYWKKRMEKKLQKNKEVKGDDQDANKVEADDGYKNRIKKWRQRKQQNNINNLGDDEENLKEPKKRWRENKRKFGNKKNEIGEVDNQVKEKQRGRSTLFFKNRKPNENFDDSALINRQNKFRRNKKIEIDETDTNDNKMRPSRWHLRKQMKQDKDNKNEDENNSIRNEAEGDNQKKRYNRFNNFRKNLNKPQNDEDANKDESNFKLGGWRAKKFKSIEDKYAKNSNEDKRMKGKNFRKNQKQSNINSDADKQEKENSLIEKSSLDNAIVSPNQ